MLRVLPWITDPAIEFIDGWIAHRQKSSPIKTFEFGLGNSTLWFLNKNHHVTSVDHDPLWIKKVECVAELFGLKSQLNAMYCQRPYFQMYKEPNYDIISIDGRDRVQCLNRVIEIGIPEDAILVLDNTERISHGSYAEYVHILKNYCLIHFEQPFVFGLPEHQATLKDRAGHRVGHRWITTIAYNIKNQYTSMGRPL